MAKKDERQIGGCMSSPTIRYTSTKRKYQPKDNKFRGISTSCSSITLSEIVAGVDEDGDGTEGRRYKSSEETVS